jgi:asparagine N-glycosylation enzyme membrane subunit Stt3
MDRRDYTILFLTLLAFIMHISLLFTSNLSNYNLYDTDSWYFIKIWADTFGTSSIAMFNLLAPLPPIISAIFTISMYYLVTRLYNKTVGFYTGAMLAIGSGLLFQNGMFGIADHHLLQVALFTWLVMLLLLSMKEKQWRWIAPLPLLFVVLIPLSPVMIELFAALVLLAIVIYFFSYLIRTKRYSIAIIAIAGLSIVSIAYIQAMNIIPYIIQYWTSPYHHVLEYDPPDPILFAIKFNVLPLVLVIGFVYSFRRKIDSIELILLAITALTFGMALRYPRMEYIALPFVIILCSVYLNRHFTRKIAHILVVIFVAISLVFGCIVVSEMNAIKDSHDGIGEALEFISNEPRGLVLSWGDYGYWIRNANQTEFANVAWSNITHTAEIFTSNRSTAKELIRGYGITYVLVTEQDIKFYPVMLQNSQSKGDYNSSMLKELIQNTSGYTSIYAKKGVVVYLV